MCNLYRLDATADKIGAAFGADIGADPWVGGYVAPRRPAPVVVRQERGVRALVPRIWGVPPPPKGEKPITNVRNLESPFWIGTLRHVGARCLVPVTCFQEWGGRQRARQQYWFSIPSQPIFAFAGIVRDSEVPSFAFLTTDANPLVGSVHPKAMPAILHPQDYDAWLSADWKNARLLIAPFPSQLMHCVEALPSAIEANSRSVLPIDLFEQDA